MKKQGFTLIELMVVIVIMGILAAVAVPKLFGMIAKSKASEVGPAAGTYVKLQEAYFSESNYIGSWTLIGYTAPGSNGTTTNFTYAGGLTDKQSTSVTGDGAWKATNNVKLNDCPSAANWYVTEEISPATTTASVGLTQKGKILTTNAAGCTALTPNFESIGG